ncbi:septum site-determining protein MinD [Escherichia coli]|uniref:Septum site-determining protein MinD n=40 Tax=root TaxID=1 RepID=A0A376YB07_ECOLX|nr:septum site-determining protein MinD [Escherichia coli]
MARIIVVTSGKGGVGKTTSSAAIATGLAQKGKKTVVIDFDIGLRNLDLIMGCERRVVYDFVNVIQGDATLNQALIKDKRTENLYILPASQTRDKDALTREGVAKVLDDLKAMDFEFIVCDSPAGIETGALMALYFADEAIITTNPEVSSVRDSDRILGILASKSRRAENGEEPIKEHLLLTRYNPGRVSRGDMLSMEDVLEILRIKLVGVIPEDQSVLRASNQGEPVILDINADAGKAYADTVERLLEKNVLSASLKKRRKASSNACSEDKLWHYSISFSRGRKTQPTLQKNGCRLLLLNAVAAMQNRIICRSCVKIFLRSFVNTYKLILRW